MSNLIDSPDVLPELDVEQLAEVYRDLLPELAAKLRVLRTARLHGLCVGATLRDRIDELCGFLGGLAAPSPRLPLIDPYSADAPIFAGAKGAPAAPGSPV